MDLENKNINNLRMLAIDMIENAKSGHPGIALDAAPTLYTLYSKILNVLPSEPNNILRDRFVLSAGHGSSIYYAVLHAFGYDIDLDDLKNFRKLNSITPGHPEYGVVPGVDATTGPLGQGVAMAVGMAIAEKCMANRFNKPDITLFDNYTYTLVGEGCLMEGVSYEAMSLAGTLKLNKLIVLYDANNVTLDGTTEKVMDMNVSTYAKSLGFNTLEVEDGNDCNQITQAILLAKKCKDKPSFIKINTHIGYGSVYQDSNKAHGACLGEDNVKLLRDKLGVKSGKFELEKDVSRDLLLIRKRFVNVNKYFKAKLKDYAKFYPGDYKVLKNYIELDYSNIDNVLSNVNCEMSMAGRELGNLVLQELTKVYPNIICGSADLSSSTKSKINDEQCFNDINSGRNLKYGIREFAMGCISNGIALYGGYTPISSTFMVFSDYLKPALRLSSLMKLKSINIFTHDSIAVGQDGATHQPCEQLWGLRTIPNMKVFRPSNLNEVKASFALAFNYDGPSSIILSRQKMPVFINSYQDCKFGGYILSKEEQKLDGIILATGSEVGLALSVKNHLKHLGFDIRVVSLPCIEIFEEQSDKYKDLVIPNSCINVFSIEAGSTLGWYKYVGKYGKCYGVDSFGDSALPEELFKKFGLKDDVIAKEIASIIKKNSK